MLEKMYPPNFHKDDGNSYHSGQNLGIVIKISEQEISLNPSTINEYLFHPWDEALPSVFQKVDSTPNMHMQISTMQD
jgi:hypothetical protein